MCHPGLACHGGRAEAGGAEALVRSVPVQGCATAIGKGENALQEKNIPLAKYLFFFLLLKQMRRVVQKLNR
jgi:hypothetical protein